MKNDYSRRKGKGNGGRFVQLFEYLLRSPAWSDLDPVARALYVELRRRYNGTNNGSIALGCREAGEALNVGKNVANRGFQALLDHGFIVVVAKSGFNQKRMTMVWALTEIRNDATGAIAPRDFLRWSPRGPRTAATSPAGDRRVVPFAKPVAA